MNKSTTSVLLPSLAESSESALSLSQKLKTDTKYFSTRETRIPSTSTKRITKLKACMAAIPLLTAATGFIAPEAQAANMLYKMDFGADTILYPPYIAYSTAGWQDIAGTDPSGKFGPINVWGATKSGFDMIADVPVTASTLGNYVTTQIQQIAGPDGKTIPALFQNVKQSNAGSGGHTQNAFMIYRGKVDSGDKTDTGDAYYSYWFKFQPDLNTQLNAGSGSWRVMSEWKTGGMNNTWKGDYRILTSVIRDGSGRLYWNTQGDNNANYFTSVQRFWTVTNNTVPVPVGQWFKYEVFWHRSNGSDGRYWAAVNGQPIVDHWGPNMGVYNLPINRIMLTNNYSGGKTPSQQWLTGLEIWNGFPCGVGVSCYGKPTEVPAPTPTPAPAPSDTTAPSAPSGLSAIASSATKVNLTWNASTDNVGVAGYRIYRDGVRIGTSTTPSYTDSTAVPGATYNYNLNAYDSAGNVSTPSNLITVRVPTSATAVKITSYYVGDRTAYSATINWTTDIPSAGTVFYGTNASNLGSTVSDSNLSTSHSVKLSGLTRRTTYYYKIKASGVSATSSFRTTRW